MPPELGAVRGAFLVAVDADGLALDPDYRPALSPSTRVTDAATRTRRGRVVGLDGYTRERPELRCSALWIQWADRDEPEYLTDLSGLISREGRLASLSAAVPIPARDEVYRARRAARAALLDEPADIEQTGTQGAGPVARAAWLDAAPIHVVRERWSPDFDLYADGAIEVHELRCVECTAAPCRCAPCRVCAWRRAPGAPCPCCHEPAP